MKKFKIIFGMIFLYRNFFRVIFDRLNISSKVTSIYYLYDNVKYKCRSHSDDFSIINELYIFKAYLSKKDRSNKVKTIIDLGAHIGIFSIQAAKLFPNAKIYAFEAFEENYNLLKENIALNNMNRQITPECIAVSSDSNKKLTLYLQDSSTGGHSITPEGQNTIQVNTITLEEIFHKYNIKQCDLLKIDIEGSETLIKKSLTKLLPKISKIYMEYHEDACLLEVWEKFFTENKFQMEINLKLKIIKATRTPLTL